MPVFMTDVYKISRFSNRSVKNMRFIGKGAYKYLLYLVYLVVKLVDNTSLQLQQVLAVTHKLKTINQHLRLKLFLQMLCLWFRASLIYINNCPTRCNTKQSIYYTASSLYLATLDWGSCTKNMTSTGGCSYSFVYSCWWVWLTPETCRVNLQNNK